MNTQVLIFLGVIVSLGVVLSLIVNLIYRKTGGLNRQKYQTEWLKIENSLDKNNLLTYQMAIMTADKLLDNALRDLGLSGETMADRLKVAKSRFADVNKVWTAHKLRNRIVHETDVKITTLAAKRALYIYKKALKELGAI